MRHTSKNGRRALSGILQQSVFAFANIAPPICRLRPERCGELFSGRSLGFVISLTLGCSSRPEKERINVPKMALVGVVAATLAFPADALARLIPPSVSQAQNTSYLQSVAVSQPAAILATTECRESPQYLCFRRNALFS